MINSRDSEPGSHSRLSPPLPTTLWDTAAVLGRCGCAAVLLFSAHLNACVSHDLWKPESRRQFRTPMLSENGAPFPVGGRPENDIRKNGPKKYHFRVNT